MGSRLDPERLCLNLVLIQPPEIGQKPELGSGSKERRQELTRRHYKPERIMPRLREAGVLMGKCKKSTEVVKELGIHKVACYRRR